MLTAPAPISACQFVRSHCDLTLLQEGKTCIGSRSWEAVPNLGFNRILEPQDLGPIRCMAHELELQAKQLEEQHALQPSDRYSLRFSRSVPKLHPDRSSLTLWPDIHHVVLLQVQLSSGRACCSVPDGQSRASKHRTTVPHHWLIL